MDTLPLTEPVLLILMSLAGQPRHGYSILKDVERMSDGRVVLSTGTLYGALRRLLDNEGRLHRMQGFALRQPLEGQHLRAVLARRQCQAGINPPTIDQNRAGAALAPVAPFLGAGQVQAFAQ